MEGERPSSAAAPSIWYAAVATPQRKSAGSALKLDGAGRADGAGGTEAEGSDTEFLSVRVT
ncbi:hypothetical protein GCM10027091_72070 [Streptomyces daliensis]